MLDLEVRSIFKHVNFLVHDAENLVLFVNGNRLERRCVFYELQAMETDWKAEVCFTSYRQWKQTGKQMRVLRATGNDRHSRGKGGGGRECHSNLICFHRSPGFGCSLLSFLFSGERLDFALSTRLVQEIPLIVYPRGCFI